MLVLQQKTSQFRNFEIVLASNIWKLDYIIRYSDLTVFRFLRIIKLSALKLSQNFCKPKYKFLIITENFRSMLHETDNELSQSRRVLKRLARSTIHNKIILIFIIIIQVANDNRDDGPMVGNHCSSLSELPIVFLGVVCQGCCQGWYVIKIHLG